ncbi:glycosyltransferase [Nitratiruptor tergarcus]|uniref:Glycosyltransferase, GT2 family n=1 Tax=Nitratiruptor tergarcus DSM 16512 TaxID=1069081 RepID=A0A1W1WUG6_9BACT|nr:glycosyltransferase [Nitratiruptor tergarcus]SMC09968.1 Glycosyltransferase, GT2 family [Nitratiruptor tergarcus DSM 16512]
MKSCVIMSVYKNDKLEYVREALNSLYNQKLKADIFIKIDGEIDKELEEFLVSEKEKGKIKYLDRRKENRGLAYSLNELIEKGLELNYNYFFRMDADDINNLDRFKKQIEFMEKNKNIDVCGTYIKEIGDGLDYEKLVKYPLNHDEMFDFFKKRVPLAHVSVCFRDSYFKKAGLYPENGHISNEDTLMWLKGFQSGCHFANIPYIGVNVRVNKDFFNRRRGIKKVWYDLKNRIEVVRTLEYGLFGYIYSIGMFFINILPPSVKKLAYKTLR